MTQSHGSVFPLLLILHAAGGCYFVGVQKLRRRGVAWPLMRSWCAAAGLISILLAMLPRNGPYDNFATEMVQHLLLTMLAPMLLALAAPATLALRVLPIRGRRVLVSLLKNRVSAMTLTAPSVVILTLGGLYGFYLTPLYDVAHSVTWLHTVIHLHMFLAGCLLTWYVVGVDPVAHRPRTRAALLVLLLGAAGHHVLAKLLYAHGLPATAGSVDQIQFGALVMFYGGSVFEILLALLYMTGWYHRTGRALRHERRREDESSNR